MDIRAIQLKELRLLKVFAVICERRGLRYFLYVGTLLGAIRHKGFIPWDDDLDVMMPLRDYRRFLRIAEKELPKGMILQRPGARGGFYLPWARIYLDGTTMMRRCEAAYDMHWGMFIDIYPMIGEAKSPFGKDLQKKLIRAARGLLRADYYRATGLMGTEYISIKKWLFRIPRPLRRLAAMMCLRLAMRPIEGSRRIGSIDAAPFEGKFSPADWEETTMLPFEDGSFCAPAKYDKILHLIYGDYMTPPPEHMRYGHDYGTGDMIYDTDRDYRIYRKELLGK